MDVNEFAPEISSIQPMSDYINITTLSTQQLEYLIQANTDFIALGDSALVKIETIDQDSIDLGPEHLSFEISGVKTIPDLNNIDQLNENPELSGLFTIDFDRQISIDMEVLRKTSNTVVKTSEELINIKSESPLIVAYVTVEIKDKGEMGINVTFVIVLMNNGTNFEELNLLDERMNKKYPNWPSLRLI